MSLREVRLEPVLRRKQPKGDRLLLSLLLAVTAVTLLLLLLSDSRLLLLILPALVHSIFFVCMCGQANIVTLLREGWVRPVVARKGCIAASVSEKRRCNLDMVLR
jgi:hypothetical protein